MRISAKEWLIALAAIAGMVLPAQASAQSQPRGFMGFSVDETKPGVVVMFVQEDSPAEVMGLRSGDEIVEMNGLPATVKDVGWPAPPGTLARLKIRRGQETFEVELTRRPRQQIKWQSGVFHLPREKVWAGLVVAIGDPALSRIYVPKQILREDGVIFFESVLFFKDTTPENARIYGLIDPEFHLPRLSDFAPQSWYVTPGVRVREKPGATVVTVTLVIDAQFVNTYRNIPTGGVVERMLFGGIWKHQP